MLEPYDYSLTDAVDLPQTQVNILLMSKPGQVAVGCQQDIHVSIKAGRPRHNSAR